MDVASVPAKFAEAFGTNAGSNYIRTIPTTTSDPNAASLSLGFPPNTATAEASGGSPPDMRDFNGILNPITAWNQWQSAGGPVFYDGTFSSDIGGYMKGSWLSNATTLGAFWISQVDNNTSNPDTGGSNWLPINLSGFGTAAYKNTTDNTKASVAAVSGSFTIGNIASFADTNGTIQDSGIAGPFGTASKKTASDGGQTYVASVAGGTISGHFSAFNDGLGTVHDTGYGPGSFDAAGTAATLLAQALLKANNLSDILNVVAARSNIGLGSAAVYNASGGAGNLSGVSSATNGNIPVFTDGNGTIGDSGISPGSIPSITINPAGVAHIGPFIIQWGNVYLPSGNGDVVSFTTTFPTALFTLTMISSGGEATYGASWSPLNNSAFYAWSFNRHFSGDPTPGPISYIAIGY